MSGQAYLLWDNAAGETELVSFDIYTEETHELACEITEFPVELSSAMSDQIVLKPKQCTFVGYVGDKPLVSNEGAQTLTTKSLSIPSAPAYEQTSVKLDIPGSPIQPSVGGLVSAGINALANAISGGPTATVRKEKGRRNDKADVRAFELNDDKSRTESVWQLMQQARNERASCRLLTDYDDTDGYRIENLQMARTPEDGMGATFTLQLRTITLAESQTVAAPKPAERLGQKAKTVGSKPAQPAQVEQDEKARRSIAAAALDATLASLGGH